MATSLIRPAAIALFVLVWCGCAGAQEGFRWHTFQYDDEEAGGRTGRLVYGVPETDNVQFVASCTTGRPGSVVAFGGPVGNFNDGDKATLQLSGRRYSQEMSGSVTRPQSGEGLYGVEIAVGHNDEFWQALTRKREIRYSIDGSEPQTLELGGSARAIRIYLRFCERIAQVAAEDPVAARSEPASDPRWDTCSAFGNVRSVRSDTPVTVKFVNRTDSYRAVMWIDLEGKPVEYATLNPGQSSTVNTYVTHPWMFTDGPGNCIEMFMPQPGVPIFEITAPNREFRAQ